MKFIYYLAAIGNPNLDIKIGILKNNLEKIYNDINQNFDIIINCYEEDLSFNDIITSFNFKFLNNIYIHTKKGVLCELWFSNNYNNKLKDYDYILFMLDDVKILNIDINKLIYIKNKYKIEFLSPKVLKATWPFMKHPKYKNLVITSRVEVYCLLLNNNDFNKFLSLNDINNPYFWGVDYLMSHFDIKTAVFHNNIVEHVIEPDKTHHQGAILQMNHFLMKYGYLSDKEIKNKFINEVIETIDYF
jgi:hypothetical protein